MPERRDGVQTPRQKEKKKKQSRLRRVIIYHPGRRLWRQSVAGGGGGGGGGADVMNSPGADGSSRTSQTVDSGGAGHDHARERCPDQSVDLQPVLGVGLLKLRSL